MTFMSASKRVLFALGVNPTARDAVMAEVPTSETLRSVVHD